MSIDDIRKHRNAEPFSPFELILNDGSKVHVALPERMALSPSGCMAYVFEGNDLACVEVARVTGLNLNPRVAPRRRLQP